MCQFNPAGANEECVKTVNVCVILNVAQPTGTRASLYRVVRVVQATSSVLVFEFVAVTLERNFFCLLYCTTSQSIADYKYT